LFPGDETIFATEFPEAWPKLELSLAARRNVLLIASEAMHNAARHAGAGHVTLGLGPAEGGRWRLWLNDDGCGLGNAESSNGSGMGIQNMKRRAEEIGASFSLTPNNGQGTSLSLIFDPKADDRTFRQSPT
jgi:signal transduction histidine kinase